MRRYRREILFVLAIVVVAIVFVLASCGKPNVLTSGKVIDKSYDDPDTIDHPGYWVSGTPARTTCTGGYGTTPQICTVSPGTPGYYQPGWTEYDGPHWKLRIQGPYLDGKEPIREWHEVSESVYNSLHMGDRWGK